MITVIIASWLGLFCLCVLFLVFCVCYLVFWGFFCVCFGGWGLGGVWFIKSIIIVY